MASNLRAEKSGFAKEMQEKISEKFDQSEAAKTIRWIRMLPPPVEGVPEPFQKALDKQQADVQLISSDDYHSYFANGLVLGYLMACLSPEASHKIASLKTWQVSDKAVFETSRQRERIGMFLNFVSAVGVDSAFLFQTDQLYEKTNLSQVIICIGQLGVEMQAKPDYQGPENFWLNKHKENVRSFTEDQIREGRNFPNLQMGYNKGANAAGISFGGRRHIM